MLQYYNMTPEDYYNLGEKANATSIYGEARPRDKNSLKVDVHAENSRSYIKLYAPVVNTLKARGNGALLAKILGMKIKEVKSLLQFKLIYDITTYKLREPRNTDTIESILPGPEYLKECAEAFDITKETEIELLKIISLKIKDKFLKSYFGKVNHIESDWPMYGDWFFHPALNFESMLKTGTSIADLEDHIVNFINSGDERICYLMNMTSTKSLTGMFMEFITVLPEAFRPKIENRHDPITKSYAKIMKLSDNLGMAYKDKNFTCNELLKRYLDLQIAVNELLLKSNPKQSSTKSIAEKLSGKKNLIRGMQAKRCDCSGRSVIIVNPKLKIDECGIPQDMIPKLYRYHHLKRYEGSNPVNILTQSNAANTKDIVRLGILDDVPVLLNRAPSLHQLSVQGYTAVPTTSRAIELHPLACEAFNADFDGDQMGVHVPLGEEAIKEAKTLMSPLYNLYHPATGEPIMVPRHEMIYGLYICTRDYSFKKDVNIFKCKSLDILQERVYSQEIKVYDDVAVEGLGVDKAGKHLIRWCVPESMYNSFDVITGKTINSLIIELIQCGRFIFKECVFKLMDVGFKIATLYSPSLKILDDSHEDEIKKPFVDFHKRMKKSIWFYDHGLMSEREYLLKFHAEMKIVEKEVKAVFDAGGIDPEDGFNLLVKSGARGGVSNLLQIYAYKGIAKKSAYETFPVTIEQSFLEGLTPLGHFMSAFGARTDTIAKTNKTADTGYASRLMYHTAVEAVVRSDDCGTEDGITISKSVLSKYIRLSDEKAKQTKVNERFFDIIKGRFIAGTNEFITEKKARELSETHQEVTIRSVLKCKDTSCVKCYGIDIAHQALVVKGQAIGIVAAQAIGGLATQLSMDQFHEGGVVSDKDVASDFDKVDALINQVNITSNHKFPLYDPVAWASGVVTEEVVSNTHKRVKIAGSNKSINLLKDIPVKAVVDCGDTLCTKFGDVYTQELLRYAGVTEAQLHLVLEMFITYRNKDDINFKHFECLVAGMTHHLVLSKGSREDLKPCKFYTNRQLLSGPVDDVRYRTVIKGVKVVPIVRASLLSNIEMERVVEGLSKALLLENTEDLEGPIQSVILGVKPKLGSYYPNYIEERIAQ